jgi:O-antigen/teichoic acid export membrane protein
LSNIVLSHLLVPQYFGLMTLLNTTVTGLTLFSDLGLTPNIILSRRGDDPAFLDTAWTMQVIRGIGLWLCCLCLSIPFAKFYGEPKLSIMVPVIGFSLVISSFNSTSLSTLARHMAVRELALLELSIQAGQLVFTVAWALIDRSVWALVFGRLFSDVARLLISRRMIPGQSNSFRWERNAVRELLNYGKWVLLSTSLMFLSSQSDRMILGKLVSLRTLGLYGIAFAVSDIPRQVILTFSGQIVVPFVSKVADLPRHEFLAVVLKYRWKVLIVSAAILGAVATLGDLVMGRIYDVRYHDATWIVTVLALGLWHTIMYNTMSPCLFAVGKRQYAVAGYFFSSLVIFAFVPLTYYKWGLVGSVWTVAFSDLPMYFVNLYGLRRERLLPVAQDLKGTVVFVLFTTAMFLARVSAGFPLPHAVALR